MRFEGAGGWLLGMVLGLVACFAGPDLAAQEPPDTVEAALDSLTTRIDSLEAMLQRLQGEAQADAAEDELEALRAAAEAAAQRPGQPQPTQAEEPEFQGRQQSLQALNPEISVNADFFAFSNTQDPDDNNFVPREVELAFQSPLDPFSRAAIFIGYHTHGGELIPFNGHDDHESGEAEHAHEESGFELEEAYVEWSGLFTGFSLKVGQMYQQLGTMNRWHSHALPFQSRSLPHLAFIGTEALGQAGVSARWLLPIGGGGAYEAVFEVTRSSTEALYGESNRPSFLGHLNGFWQLSQSWDLEVGLSATGGPFRADVEPDEPTGGEPVRLEFDQRLYNLEGSLTWRPPGRALYRGVNVRGGVMVRDPRGLEGVGAAWGGWLWGDVRLSRRWLAGGRVEWVEDPDGSGDTAWLLAPTLRCWQCEWVRLRFDYDHL